MANGIVMSLASKKSALFSQYRRAEETPVFVSQYIVMLSRMSSRVRSLCRRPCRACSTSPGWPVPSPAQVGEFFVGEAHAKLADRGVVSGRCLGHGYVPPRCGATPRSG